MTEIVPEPVSVPANRPKKQRSQAKWSLRTCLCTHPELRLISDVASIVEGDWSTWKFWLYRAGLGKLRAVCEKAIAEARLVGVTTGKVKFADIRDALMTIPQQAPVRVEELQKLVVLEAAKVELELAAEAQEAAFAAKVARVSKVTRVAKEADA